MVCTPMALESVVMPATLRRSLRANLLAVPTTREERLAVLNSIRHKLVKILQRHLAWTFLHIATRSLNTKWIGLLGRVSYLVGALRDILNANAVIRWTRTDSISHSKKTDLTVSEVGLGL
jgi:hypothetical protein